MFGFLKKKLKEGIEKISKVVSEKEEEKIEQAVEEVKKEEMIEQPKEELVKEVEKEIEKTATVEEKFSGVRITYFVHGTTKDNEKKLSSGWSDSELSDLGKKQSIELREIIKDKKFDAVFCSDLKRSVDSAKLAFGDFKAIVQDKRLREINYGDLNGTDSDNIDSLIPKHIDSPFPKGESYKDVERRVADFLNTLLEYYNGKNVAIVCHRAPQLALDVLIKGKTWEHAIEKDWRLSKKWQPGWEYALEKKIETKAEANVEEKKEIEAVQQPKIEEKISPVQEVSVEEKEIEIEKKIEKEPEVKIEKAAEEKMEEAKEIVETLKEVEKIKEEKPTEKAIEEFTENIEKVELPVAICEEKKKLFGFLRKKPKKEEPVCPIKPEPPKEEPKKIEEPVEEKGIIDKIRKKITEKKIEEQDVKDILAEIENSLVSSDVAMEVAEKIIGDLRGNLVGKFIKKGEIEKVIKESIKSSITEILNVQSFDLMERIKTKKPFVIVFLGFNGVGKTTSIARIGYMLKKGGVSCVFAAADSWRAAAIEQLEEHGKKLDIEVIKHKYGADPAAVIFDAVKHANSKGIDVVLADTAGRSHSNANLMDELKKIIKVNKPDLKILVLDALTGNDIYDQCKLFNEAVGVDAMILTKADVYEKGGAALAASHTINKPIIYMGVGQNYEDLEKFDPKKIAEKLLD